MVKQVFDASGAIRDSVDGLKKKLTDKLGDQLQALDGLHQQLRTSADLQRRSMVQTQQMVAILTEERRNRLDAERRAAVSAADIQSIRAGAFVISTIVGGKDGRLLGAAVNAALDVRKNVEDFNRNLSLLADRGTLGSFESSITLVGGLLGVGLQLASLFESDKPSADQIILEQLGNLSKQLSQFQDEVRDRFDRVDRALNSIYTDMVKGFDQVLHAIEDVNQNVREAARALNRTGDRLSVVESRLSEKLDFLIDSSFRMAMSLCLNYSRDHGEPIPPSEFATCVGNLRDYVEKAHDPVLSGAWTPDMSVSAKLFDQLEAQDFSSKINLFRGMLGQFGPVPTAGTLPNPTRWLSAARLYVALASGNLEAFRKLPTSFLDDLSAEGERILQQLNWDVPRGAAPQLINAYQVALDKYTAELREFVLTARSVRTKTLRDMGAKITDLGPQDVFDGDPRNMQSVFEAVKDQAIMHMECSDPDAKAPTQGAICTGDASWPPLKSSAGMWQLILRSGPIAEAVALGTGKVEAKYFAYWDKVRDGRMQSVRFVFGRPGVIVCVYVTPSSGKRILVARFGGTSGVEAIESAATGGATAYAELGLNRPFDFRSWLTQTDVDIWNKDVGSPTTDGPAPGSNPPSSGPPTLDGMGQLNAENQKRRTQLLAAMRDSLSNEALRSTSDLAAAIKNMEAWTFALRGITSLIFPKELLQNERLRALLFGTPASLTVAPFYGRGAKHTDAPLLSRVGVLSLLGDIQIPKDFVFPPTAAANKPTQFEPTAWSDSVLLRNLDAFGEPAVRALHGELDRALLHAQTAAQLEPTISDQLGRLQLLRELRRVAQQ